MLWSIEYSENQKVITLAYQLDLLLKTYAAGKNKEVQAFIRRLNKNRQVIFTFLHHPKVPLIIIHRSKPSEMRRLKCLSSLKLLIGQIA
jgi:hypothetical protein